MHLSTLHQRLHALGAKPCHIDRVLRGWSQVASYDRKGSPAETFFPASLRNALPAIEAELAGLARLKSEHLALSPSPHGTTSHSTKPASGQVAGYLPPAGEGKNNDVSRLLVELRDGQMVESVLLPRGGLCVSTQVGCAVGCVFCMSGRDGLLRQLSSLEIVAQVALARQRRAVNKVVFMGMGEPAHNLDNVLEAIELLGIQGNIGHKDLVLSTVGDVRVFERLMERFTAPASQSSRASTPILTFPLHGGRDLMAGIKGTVKPALAISLHSTDDALRAQLLPKAPAIAVAELVERAEAYARATHYPTQYQWTLLEGVNDGEDELVRIIELLGGKYAVMNFIPFNPVDGLDFRRPSRERIAAMVQTLNRNRIYTRIRDSAGQEVEGACGQLRARMARTTAPAPLLPAAALEAAP